MKVADARAEQPETSTDTPARPAGRRLVFILGALSALGPLSIDMYLPALPELSRVFTATESQIQLTLSACLLGLAMGQIVAGPLSDALGRRRPLLVGMAIYALASLLCMVAPSAGALAGLRFVQGLAGAAGIVIARAIVRDLFSGVAIARFFSVLMLVSGAAPILAPVIGGQLLTFTSWRGVFFVLAVFGALLLLLCGFGLAESLPEANRQSGGLSTTLATFRRLLADRMFVGLALAGGLSFAAMFAYISGSPFVLQNLYGVSPQLYSIIFGVNALGLITVGQLNGRLVGRVAPERLLLTGISGVALGGLALLIIVGIGGIGLAGILPALFVLVASQGMVLPNATTLALADHPRSAGSASALLGVMQFAIGAVAAPLVGLGDGSTALPMALVIALLGGAALATYLLMVRRAV